MDQKLKTYPSFAYDEHFCIKIGIGLWIVMLFLLRPYLAMLLSFANTSDPTELIDLVFDTRRALALQAVAALPAMMLFVAYSRRRPAAGAAVRWIWHRGKTLLILSVLGNLSILLGPIFWENTAPGFSSWVQAVAAMGMVFYLFRSERVRDTFHDFPAANAKLKSLAADKP